MSNPQRRPGFVTTLFDATFKNLLTVRLVRVLYLLALISIGTYAFILLFVGIGQGGFIALLSVVAVPTLAFLTIGVVRVLLEALVTVFRLGEQTEEISKTLYSLSTYLRSDRPDDA